MEDFVKTAPHYISLGIELIAAIIITYACIITLFLYIRNVFSKRPEEIAQKMSSDWHLERALYSHLNFYWLQIYFIQLLLQPGMILANWKL